jgi:sodium/pantothenate symporter
MQAVFDSPEVQDPALLSGPGPGNFLPLSAAMSFFAIYALSAPGQPSLLTRFLTCRDTATIRRSCFIIGVYILLVYPAVMTLGVVGRALVPELEAPDHAMPATILAAAPPALAGILLAAPFAAIMSTVSSYLLVTSSAVVRDLYSRNRKGSLSDRRAQILTRSSTFGLAALTLAFALQPPAFLQCIVIFAGTGLGATFLFPTLLTIYWPRMNHAGFVAGMTAGLASFLVQYATWGTRSFGGFDPFVWSLIISAGFAVGGVRLGKRTSQKTLEIYFDNDPQ